MNGCCIAAVASITLAAIGIAVVVIIYVATQTSKLPRIDRRIERLTKRITKLENPKKEVKGDSDEEYYREEFSRRTRRKPT